MRSKAEIVQDLSGKAVLDVGGAGYGEENPYERELVHAWSTCSRTVVDTNPKADIVRDFNTLPIEPLSPDHPFDVATLFGIIEHVHHPVDLLKWVPCSDMIINFPNVDSFIARAMEEGSGGTGHITSWTPFTARALLREAGWEVTRMEYTFGKWSLKARAINAVGSLFMPRKVGTDFCMWATRRG